MATDTEEVKAIDIHGDTGTQRSEARRQSISQSVGRYRCVICQSGELCGAAAAAGDVDVALSAEILAIP
jgi:hypothetical protein